MSGSTLKKLIFSLLVFAATPASSLAADAISAEYRSPSELQEDVLTGHWTGTMLVGPKEYPINLWFDNGPDVTGRIELIGVTTADNPLGAITVSENKVSFELASRPPQKFEGEIRNDTMTGTIDISGMMASFSVQKLTR